MQRLKTLVYQMYSG